MTDLSLPQNCFERRDGEDVSLRRRDATICRCDMIQTFVNVSFIIYVLLRRVVVLFLNNRMRINY
jgi:hypothetical protein